MWTIAGRLTLQPMLLNEGAITICDVDGDDVLTVFMEERERENTRVDGNDSFSGHFWNWNQFLIQHVVQTTKPEWVEFKQVWKTCNHEFLHSESWSGIIVALATWLLLYILCCLLLHRTGWIRVCVAAVEDWAVWSAVCCTLWSFCVKNKHGYIFQFNVACY